MVSIPGHCILPYFFPNIIQSLKSSILCYTLLVNQGAPYVFRKKAIFRNQYNEGPHLTQNRTWESDKNINILSL